MLNTNTHPNQHRKSDDLLWYFLAEFSLSEFLLDHHRRNELTAKLIFQMVRELGISPEYIDHIEIALTEFAKEAPMHFEQSKPELPEHIRIYCQSKIIDRLNLTNTSKSGCIEQATKNPERSPGVPSKKIGGWGYFLIERYEDFPPHSSAHPRNCIDLYLYKEGN